MPLVRGLMGPGRCPLCGGPPKGTPNRWPMPGRKIAVGMGKLGRGTKHEQLLQAALQLTGEHSTPVVLQRIVEMAAELTGARYAALGVIDRKGWLSDFLTTGLSRQERERIGPLPQGHGILGVLIKDPRPLRLQKISRDPQSVGFPPNHPPMFSFLGARSDLAARSSATCISRRRRVAASSPRRMRTPYSDRRFPLGSCGSG